MCIIFNHYFLAARRGTDSALADVSPEQELLVSATTIMLMMLMVLVMLVVHVVDQVRSNNVTVSGGATEVVGKQLPRGKKGNGGKRKAKDVAAEWQAALGPYPVVSPGTRWRYSQHGKYMQSNIKGHVDPHIVKSRFVNKAYLINK